MGCTKIGVSIVIFIYLQIQNIVNSFVKMSENKQQTGQQTKSNQKGTSNFVFI